MGEISVAWWVGKKAHRSVERRAVESAALMVAHSATNWALMKADVTGGNWEMSTVAWTAQ
jgi:hypothetical protein